MSINMNLHIDSVNSRVNKLKSDWNDAKLQCNRVKMHRIGKQLKDAESILLQLKAQVKSK